MKTIFALTLLAAGLCATPLLHAQEKPTETKKIEKHAPLNVNPDQAEKILRQQTNIIILDVRTPKEFSEGHLTGATNIDFFSPDFSEKLSKLDKDKSYLVHCAVGGRSAKARDKMKAMKFNSIYHLEGGMKAWEEAGKKVEK